MQCTLSQIQMGKTTAKLKRWLAEESKRERCKHAKRDRERERNEKAREGEKQNRNKNDRKHRMGTKRCSSLSFYLPYMCLLMLKCILILYAFCC